MQQQQQQPPASASRLRPGPAPNPTEFGDAAAAAQQARHWRGLAHSMRAGMRAGTTVYHSTPERAERIAREFERLENSARAAARAEFSGRDLMDAQPDAQPEAHAAAESAA
jgi:hypothetical protein